MNVTPSYSSLCCHIILYTEDGELWGWGDNTMGSVGTGDTKNCREPRKVMFEGGEIVQFASGWNHNLAITKEGKLYVWGNNNEYQLGFDDNAMRTTPTLLEMPNSLPVIHVACSRDSSYAVTSDGSLFAWGVNSSGQCGISPVLPTLQEIPTPQQVPLPFKVVQVRAGRDHVYARTQEGETWVWGYNWFSQCGKESSDTVNPGIAFGIFGNNLRRRA